MSHATVALHQERDMLQHVCCCYTRLSVRMLYALPMQLNSFTTKVIVARVGSLFARLRATGPAICSSITDSGKSLYPSTKEISVSALQTHPVLNGHWWLFPRGYEDVSIKLTT